MRRGPPPGPDRRAAIPAHAIRTARQRAELSGLYHLVAGGVTSWHGYAGFVLDFARQAGIHLKVAADAIKPVPTTAYPTPARRPLNSRMDSMKLRNSFDLHLPDWKIGVARMLSEVLEKT